MQIPLKSISVSLPLQMDYLISVPVHTGLNNLLCLKIQWFIAGFLFDFIGLNFF